MKKPKMNDTAQNYERTLKTNRDKYILRLYIAGLTPKSSRAIIRIRELCKTHLKGFHQLEVIDIYQQPELAREDQIIAAPTLVKFFPPPMRRFIGDLTNTEKLIRGLEVRPIE